MGAHISKIKHLKLDQWEDAQVTRMREVGNINAKLKYERWVPPSYRKVERNTPQTLVEQWIFAKYAREEFIHPERQSYTSGFMEGYLMKKGRENNQFLPRKFVLSEVEDTIKYYVKDSKDPKAVIKISDINVAFSPKKIPFPNSLQIDYLKNGSTRHLYLYHDDPQTVVNWYHAIRCCKLHLLQVGYPAVSSSALRLLKALTLCLQEAESELISHLSSDYTKEGHLHKTGPSPNDVYKKRWCTLGGRKLMYHVEPLDAYPKVSGWCLVSCVEVSIISFQGEIFLGHTGSGYLVVPGFGPGFREQGFGFILHTPDRAYQVRGGRILSIN